VSTEEIAIGRIYIPPTERDLLCLSCSLPDCNMQNPRCAWKLAKHRTNRGRKRGETFTIRREAKRLPKEKGMKMKRAIDPRKGEYRDRPLWCVYGPECFPTMFCCSINLHPTCGLTIWGYSVYQGEPGFRTLGRKLDKWAEDAEAVFFAEQAHALEHMARITTPEVM
jgi:hypothetical protein